MGERGGVGKTWLSGKGGKGRKEKRTGGEETGEGKGRESPPVSVSLADSVTQVGQCGHGHHAVWQWDMPPPSQQRSLHRLMGTGEFIVRIGLLNM